MGRKWFIQRLATLVVQLEVTSHHLLATHRPPILRRSVGGGCDASAQEVSEWRLPAVLLRLMVTESGRPPAPSPAPTGKNRFNRTRPVGRRVPKPDRKKEGCTAPEMIPTPK